MMECLRIRSPASVASAKIFQHRIGDGERSGWKYLNRTPALSDKVSRFTQTLPDIKAHVESSLLFRLPITTQGPLRRFASLNTFRRPSPPTTGAGCAALAKERCLCAREKESVREKVWLERSNKRVLVICRRSLPCQVHQQCMRERESDNSDLISFIFLLIV